MAIVAHERGRTCPKCGFGNSQRSNKCVVCGHGLPKYRNVKVEIDGIVFGSQKEANRYKKLCQAKKMGLINNLEVHPKFEFRVNGEKIGSYTSDFSYLEMSGSGIDKEAELVVEDVKSQPTMTATYRRNKKLMKAVYGIEVREL